MSATPDSTFTNPEPLIADLQRQLVECRAELDKAQRNLNETTTERDEALARETALAEVMDAVNHSSGVRGDPEQGAQVLRRRGRYLGGL